MDVVCREYQASEAAEACAFTEQIFGPLPLEYWLREPRFTASMAYLGEELVGVIPLSLRAFQFAPGIVAGTAWENAVGTREDLRSRGIGTAMIRAAAEFLQDRCDWLCVYRGAERSDGYRFYADKTGHVDLCYIPFYHLSEPAGTIPDGYVRLDWPAVREHGEALSLLWQSHWGAYGGCAVRDEGFYPWIIDNIIYGRIPTTRTLHVLYEEATPVAFCLTGLREEGARADHTLRILDFAALVGSLHRSERLLDGVLAHAAERGVPVSWPHAVDSPLVPLMLGRGFERGPRRMMVMARPIRPQALFAKLTAARGGCSLTVDVWTPTLDCRLYDAGSGAPRVILEMKDRELALLLASRLDGAVALDEERITAYGPAPLDRVRETIGRLGRCVPWVHHYVEWL